MLTSGIILDQHDDEHAYVVRKHFKTAEAIPDLLKQATPDPRNLPDEAFALIIQEGDHKLRKYAMSDKSSAAKSAFYFMSCGAKLPEPARQVAATKLAGALYSYGIQPPAEMLKLAAIPKAMVDDSFDVKGKYRERAKSKESAGTGGASLSRLMSRKKKEGSRSKTAAPTRSSVMRKIAARMSNTVDTTGLSPDSVQVPTSLPGTEDMYALVKEGRAMYPIDSLDRLNDAVHYFVRYEERFDPQDRREYCTKVASRCLTLGLEPPVKMKHYAAQEKNAQAIAVGLYQRDESLPTGHEMKPALAELAKEAMYMAPDLLVHVFEEFDKQAGLDEYWDHGVPNPVLSVYREKTAGEGQDGEAILFQEGNDRMSERQLRTFMRGSNYETLEDVMGDSIAEGLRKDPVAVFNSLPDPHKIQICRLVTDNSDGRDKTHPVELS